MTLEEQRAYAEQLSDEAEAAGFRWWRVLSPELKALLLGESGEEMAVFDADYDPADFDDLTDPPLV